MIKNKSDLAYYLECDKIALMIPRDKKRPSYFDNIWKYEISLRKSEYYLSQNGIINKLLYVFWYFRFRSLGVKLSIEIWPNQFGPGLSIAHAGGIVVNGNARIGANCRIHEGVTIGATNGQNEAAQIGNNVFIGSGAKIIGNLSISDDVAIGAGAVVTKSVTEVGITVGGIPARKISDHGSSSNIVKATDIVKNMGK